MNLRNNLKKLFIIALPFLLLATAFCQAELIPIEDDTGKTVLLDGVPQRVVSLVPSATEILFAIGADYSLAGITFHSSSLQGAADKPVVGGFFAPSIDRIAALKPDLIIASDMHVAVVARLMGLCPVIVMNTKHMEDSFRHIRMMGKLFHREEEAEKLVADNKRILSLITEKIAKIPEEKRKKVMRLMGREEIMTPGNNSFQNEMIRAAGGVPPDFGQGGQIVPVTRDQFVGFNPQLLYGCGEDLTASDPLLQREGWNSVDAVKQGNIHSFPCELTCRASSHLGYFVSWLSSLIYRDEFGDAANEVLAREIIQKKEVAIDLDFVKEAGIATSIVHDFANKSLIVDFTSSRTVVSTLDGQRDQIITVGNHYSPPPCWALNHTSGLKELKNEILPVLGKDPETATFLFTGADMDNLAVVKETFKEMTVYGLVTAGVRGNAVRMAKDVGSYYEPGTINMIFLSNMRLTPRAMTRAIISATEGKTAALQDLDIRSSYQPLTSSATGTGTDNIIVVQGDGQLIDNAGGHSKMGELIARAAYKGVKEAIEKQNGITNGRDIFQRLRDYHLNVRRLVDSANGIDKARKKQCSYLVEQLLLDPVYSGFIEAAMEVSDGFERGAVDSLQLFESWCLDVAGNIANTKVIEVGDFVTDPLLPVPMKMAFNAILSGIMSSSDFTDGRQQ